MNIKDLLSDKAQSDLPIFYNEFYSSIYKKTEKVVCATYVITDVNDHKGHIEELIDDVRSVAKDALRTAVKLVSSGGTEGRANGAHAIEELASLRSLLYVLVAARGVRGELIDVIAREIDTIIESIYLFSHQDERKNLGESVEYRPEYILAEKRQVHRATPTSRRPYRRIGAGTPSGPQASVSGRREAILSIIRARGVVSIKDISDSITDCSEKTIQRELTDMIKDNVIVKEGERRWSKYALPAG